MNKKGHPFSGRELHGILADIGVSSPQIDTPDRGFSYRVDGPLDCRMHGTPPQMQGTAQTAQPAGSGAPSSAPGSGSVVGQSGAEGADQGNAANVTDVTAADLVNLLPEAELVRVLRDFGEEREAPKIARAIVARRKVRPIERTLDLADIVEGALRERPFGGTRTARPGASGGGVVGGGNGGANAGGHPAARTFQALRIAVNSELKQLSRLLATAPRLLAPGGSLCIITFHSLEDRMVKRAFSELVAQGLDAPAAALPPGLIPARPGTTGTTGWDGGPKRATFAPGPVVYPSPQEILANPRSRSATLRVLKRAS